MRGLDPRIHLRGASTLKMDTRVKPACDGLSLFWVRIKWAMTDRITAHDGPVRIG